MLAIWAELGIFQLIHGFNGFFTHISIRSQFYLGELYKKMFFPEVSCACFIFIFYSTFFFLTVECCSFSFNYSSYMCVFQIVGMIMEAMHSTASL